MEISTIGRPRNVGWVRAAALLYGDWGTSKAYVIGLGIAAVGFSALPHLVAVCLLTALVGVNYIWICKHFPTGGGVYSAARLHSRRLAMVGGLLLLADFIVTASLSCLDAFHYLGFGSVEAKKWAITAIFCIGVMNFFGPKHTGGIAVWLALPTVVVVVVLIGAGVPHLHEFHARALTGGLLHNWVAFVGMILALSGVEAAASNTGVLRLDAHAPPDKPSVHITSSRAVRLVMLEVVLGTALLSVMAMCLPAEAAQHRDDLLRYMGETFVGPWFGKVVGVVFALLLLSAVNTAVAGMVSLLYVMAHDGELPHPFTQLNPLGVPWLPLIVGTILPVIVLNLEDSVEGLGHLYAIGVVGAIVINIGSTAFAKSIELSRHERIVMKLTLVILALVWTTIATTKLPALVFVTVVVGAGLLVREFTSRRQAVAPATTPVKPEPAAVPSAVNQPAPQFLGQFILVAARGWTPALQFAVEETRVRAAQLLVLYIREVAVSIDMRADWKDDPYARDLFTRLEAESKGLRVNRLYSVSDSPADTIIDIAATFGVDSVVLGGSRRATLVNLLKGNIVTRVAANLPESMHLIVIG
jgi:amino acid transporter/nucleotide-binding universal stress UspA family protein